jgi:secretin/TonB-like protein
MPAEGRHGVAERAAVRPSPSPSPSSSPSPGATILLEPSRANMSRPLVPILALLAAACAPPAPPAEPSTALAPIPWQPVATTSETGPASTSLPSSPPVPTETRVIGERPPAPDPGSLRGTGGAVDLDVKDADVGDVCRLLADVGHVNLVVGDGVEGRVTVRMHHVRWDKALEAILAAKGYRAVQDGNIVTVLAK